jgi:hypothetical protein
MAKKLPIGRKIYQMAIKYTKIFHSKTVQNLPKIEFLVWKQTIWQPSSTLGHEFSAFRGARQTFRPRSGLKTSRQKICTLAQTLFST